MHTLIRRQGLRRSLLVVVTVALLLALLPTAAFASAGGNYRQPRYAPQHQQYNRHTPQRYDWNYRNDRYDRNHRYDRCATTYRVRRGDTLSEIARHYRVSVRSLVNANNIRNANRIYAGTQLCIPN